MIPLPAEELQRLVDKLQQRQVELEQQCERLRRANLALDKELQERTAQLHATNQTLRQSEEDFRAIFELASVGMAQADPATGQWLRVNQKLCAITGYSAPEMLRLHIRDITHPEDRQADWEAFQRVVRGQAPDYRMEKRYVRQDGTLAWVNVNMTVIRDATGQATRTIGAIEDITQRKLAEALLRRESAFNAAVLDTARAVVLVLDAAGRIVRFNPFCELVSGYAATEALGRYVWDFLLVPEEIEGVLHQWQIALQTGGDPGYENYWKGKDGQLRRLLWRSAVVPDERGLPEYVVAIALDVTERKRAEDALRKREQELADFFAASPIGLLWVGPDGCILRVNQAQLELLGCRADQVLGRPLGEFHLEPEVAANVLKQVARHDTVRNHRARIRHQGGAILEVLIDANGLWEKDRLVHSRWFVRDITRRVQLEREILTISEREQRRLGHDLHDDLCQQLAGIEFHSQSLARDLATQSAAAAQVKAIAQAVQQALSQTRELARGLSPVGLEAEGLMEGLRQLAARTSKVFRRDCQFRCAAPVLVPDHTVAIHLYRIAQEAVGNAVKHGQADRIEILLAAAGQQVRLAVRDNGVGLPRKLPTPAGMGLRIMQYRAGVIGGTLTVQRRRSGGTRVVCTVTDGLLSPTPSNPK